MILTVEGLDVLSSILASPLERMIVTAVGLLVIAGLGWLVRRRSGAGGPMSEFLRGLFLAGVVLAVGAVVVGVWGLAPLVGTALERTGLGPETIGRVVLTVAVLAGAVVIVRFLRRLIDEFAATQDALSEHQQEVTYRLTQITLYLTAGFIAIGFWPVDLSGFLVGAGFLGIIVGLAARQTLASVLAGFVLMFSRPFEIGDWIAVENDEGIVTDITTVNTRIQTFDGEYVIIPNGVVSAQTVTNRSRKGRLRLRVEVGVDYDTDLEHATAVIEAAIEDVEAVMAVPTPQVIVTGFGDSAILFEIRFWIDKPSARRRWRAIESVVRAVREAFRQEGIKIPFPQRELSGRRETGGFRIATDEKRGPRTVARPEGASAPDGDDA